MRYVVVVMGFTFFLVWDALYNEGKAVASTVREVHRIVRMVAG